MSRRATVIEEFDDDTDLALPSKFLPNTGTRGAILEALSDDEDEGDSEPGPATPSYAHFKERESAGGFISQPTVTQNYPKDGAYLKCVPLSACNLSMH
jgi:signal recognition particle subunit SRP19